jgi:hypothetical protein
MDITTKLDQLEVKTQNPIYARQLAAKAIEAICQGPGSDGWREYILEIVGPNAPSQLARLSLADDASDQDWVRKNCAYIVSNAICGTGTTTRTRNNVDNSINTGLPDEPLD